MYYVLAIVIFIVFGDVAKAPEMYLIALWRDIIDKVDNKCALRDVKCTKAIADEIKKTWWKRVYV